MKLGFIIPNYPNEKRVALLPKDIINFKDKIYVEKDFGEYLNIEDSDYVEKGCQILSRKEIFECCDAIFSLKLIQKSDYEKLRDNQIVIGWVHPTGSGKEFMNIAKEKNLYVIDLDNVYPSIYFKNKKNLITFLSRDFIRKNSEIAGKASVLHAILSFGKIPNSNSKVAILSIGNVSQGAIQMMSKFNTNIRVFTRRTMPEFLKTISEYDFIVNGIEILKNDLPIISFEDKKKIKKGCLVIDSAADANGAIQGTNYTTISNPIIEKDEVYYYCVNNAPTIFYKDASYAISESFSKNIFTKGIDRIIKELKNS